ncbi:MAG: hypothetical protein LUH82_02670 [Clostridiales bacterium]|nr:hypothetical protein [Clostridiales bacterium]
MKKIYKIKKKLTISKPVLSSAPETSKKETQANTQEIFKAMEIYIQEYIHRDKCLWKQSFTFYYATLIVIFAPYFTNLFNMPEQFLNKMWLFPAAGVVMALIFLFRAFSLGKRFQAISFTYDKLIKSLPKQLQRESIENKFSGKTRKIKIYLLPFLMFLSLFILSIVMLCFVQ